MSGKLIIGFVAAAVSSASAATVGVVYTKIVHTHNIDAPFPVAEVPASSAQLKTAVVLNANEGYFDSFKDSSSSDEVDAPVCSGVEDSQRCVVVARASDVHLKILGYTLSLPPIWLGGDSQDADTSNADGLSEFFFNGPEVVVHRGRRNVRPGKGLGGPPSDSKTDGLNGPQSQDGANTDKTSETDSSQNPSDGQGGGELIVLDVFPSPPSTGMIEGALQDMLEGAPSGQLPQSVLPSEPRARHFNPLDALFPRDPANQFAYPIQSPYADWQTPSTSQGTPVSETTVSMTNLSRMVTISSAPSSVIPEAPTWTMTLAGFAALGLLKRRRIAAAFRSPKG